MCGEQDESISHLCFNCKVATKIWNMCNKWIGILGANHYHIQAYFEQFHLLELTIKKICYVSGCGLL